jgi:hypothetical protein
MAVSWEWLRQGGFSFGIAPCTSRIGKKVGEDVEFKGDGVPV